MVEALCSPRLLVSNSKTISYTIKVITEKYISQESESWKQEKIGVNVWKKNHVSSSSPPSPPGLLLPGCWPPNASPPLGPCWAPQLLWEIGGWEDLHWCWLLTSPPLLGPCWARQLWEVSGEDNSSHYWLVPLCLGVHWDVHLAIVDEAEFAGLPEQRLAIFITSYYEQIRFLTFWTLWTKLTIL